MSPIVDFDIQKLRSALDQKRIENHLSEQQMMEGLNSVNNQLNDIPMSLATVKNMVKRNDTSCQHALHILRWLGKTPECFLVDSDIDQSLPFGKEGKLYWDMRFLANSVVEEKSLRNLTWSQAAEELSCKPNQLSGLTKIRYGVSIHLAMKITQWLKQPSTKFIVAI